MIKQFMASLASGTAIAMLTIPGCDPVINVAGANFPAWLFCAILGTIMAAGFRPLFVAAGLEPWLGPLILIYPCLAILLACLTYLLFFNRI